MNVYSRTGKVIGNFTLEPKDGWYESQRFDGWSDADMEREYGPKLEPVKPARVPEWVRRSKLVQAVHGRVATKALDRSDRDWD